MKVALIHYRLLLKGGLESRLINYMNYCSSKGFDTTIITSKIDPSIPIPANVNIEKIHLSQIPKPVRMYFFNEGLKKIMPKHHFDYSLSLGRTAYQDAVICPGNHIGYLKAMGSKIYSPVDWMNIFLDKKAFKNSKKILAASGMMKDELIEYYSIDPGKIEVAYPPVDTDRFNAALKARKSEFREKYDLPLDKKIFLFVSTSHRIKNIKLLLQLFDFLDRKDIHLAVAGNPLKTGIKNITNLGFIKDMHELYAAADYTIHPSKYEAFAQVVAESLQCLTPVIISHKTGAKELVTPAEGIIVKNFALDSWKAAVEEALRTSFHIQPDFAKRNVMTLEQHMQKVLPIS